MSFIVGLWSECRRCPASSALLSGGACPLTGNNWLATLDIEGQPAARKPSDLISLPLRSVTPDYFKLLGLKISDGRDFRSSDTRNAPNVAVVNQALADRYFPHVIPIGKKLWIGGRERPPTEIVGVVANARTGDLTQAAEPEIYLSLWQASAFSKHLVLRTAADPRSLMAAVQRELRSVDPTVAIENVKTLEQIRDDSLASRTFAMQLLVGFALVGSVLTLVGYLWRACALGRLSPARDRDSHGGRRRAARHSEPGFRGGLSADRGRRDLRHCRRPHLVARSKVLSF